MHLCASVVAMVYPLILFIGSIHDVRYKCCYTYNDCFLHIYILLATIGVQGAQRPKRPLNFKPFYFLGFLFFNRSRISSAAAVKIAVKIARTIVHMPFNSKITLNIIKTKSSYTEKVFVYF